MSISSFSKDLTSAVSFFFETKDFTLGNRNQLKLYIRSIFKREKKQLSSINFIFCSDKRLLEINKQFLQHNYYTDIITFDLSVSSATEAEVYISIDRVKNNAKSLGNSFKDELHRVIFHGALHLCGYKDKTINDQKQMRAKEEYYLFNYFKK